MTKLEEAARIALEALEYRKTGDPDPEIPERKAAEAIRAALETGFRNPKVGETWYVLLPGALACKTVIVKDITKNTVLLLDHGRVHDYDGTRYPLDTGIRFVEKSNKENP